MKRFLACVFFVFFTACLFAEDISVRIYSNKDNVTVGEMFKVSVEATGTQSLDFVEDPDFGDGFSVLRNESFMSMSMTNGAITRSYTVTYYLRAQEEGSHSIGPFEVKVKRDTYQTNQITVNVSQGTSTTNQSHSNSNQSSGSTSSGGYRAVDRSNRNYLIKVNVDKTTAYKNEPIFISVDLYIRANVQTISYEPLKLPSAAWIERINDDQNLKGTKVIDGVEYQHYEIESKRIFISKEGEYDVPPVVYNFHGLSPRSYSFFSSYEPMTLMTEAFKLQILPLPKASPSQKFSGMVGQYTYEASVNQTEVNVKDITTLTVVLTGAGNFHSMQDVDFKVDDSIDVFSSKNSTTELPDGRKQKKWEILLQPNEVGQHEINVGDFVYFDTKSESYKTLVGKNIKIKVNKKNRKDDEEDSKIIHYTEDSKPKNVVNDLSDISYIKTTIGKNNGVYNYNLWFEIFVYMYIILVVLIALFIFLRYVIFKSRNAEAIAENRAKNAFKSFTTNIDKFAKDSSKSKDNLSNQIDKLYKILEQYFIARYHLDSVEFTSKGLQEKLSSFVSAESLAKLRDLILQFDMIRYAGLESDTSLMDLIKKLTEVIAEIEKQKSNAKETV